MIGITSLRGYACFLTQVYSIELCWELKKLKESFVVFVYYSASDKNILNRGLARVT